MLLFENPISTGKVRNNTFWYKYRNGMILIEGTKYYLYSIKEAVYKWRKANPIK